MISQLSHLSPVSGVACWQNTYVATAGYDNRVVLWDAATDTAIARANHDHLVNQCVFTSDGNYLLTASSDYSARVWTVPGLRLHAVLGDHRDDVEMVVPHPSMPLVATASRDHDVRVFDLHGELKHVFQGHSADVISVEWAERSDELVSSSDDGTIKRWSLTTGQLVSEINMAGVETDTVALDADGTVYAGNDDGEVVTLRGSERHVVQAHEAGVKRLVLDGESERLVSLSYDRTAVLWDVRGLLPVEISRFEFPDDVWPRSCAFADADHLVFATFGDRYRRYDVHARSWGTPALATPGLNAVAVNTASSDTDLVVGDAGVVWSRIRDDGELTIQSDLGSLCNFLTPATGVILTGGQMGRLMDALSGQMIYQHRSPLNCAVAFERGGVENAVVGTYTGEGLLLRHDGAVWHFIREIPLLANAVKGVAASDRTIFAVGADCSATWWDIDSMSEIRTVHNAHSKIANGCTWVDKQTFASVSRDLMLRLWNEQGQAETLRTPHDHSIKCVTTLRSSTGAATMLATGAYDGTVAVLDLASRQWSRCRRVSTSGISSLAADHDRGVFLASSYDGNVYVVSAMTERELSQNSATQVQSNPQPDSMAG